MNLCLLHSMIQFDWTCKLLNLRYDRLLLFMFSSIQSTTVYFFAILHSIWESVWNHPIIELIFFKLIKTFFCFYFALLIIIIFIKPYYINLWNRIIPRHIKLKIKNNVLLNLHFIKINIIENNNYKSFLIHVVVFDSLLI